MLETLASSPDLVSSFVSRVLGHMYDATTCGLTKAPAWQGEVGSATHLQANTLWLSVSPQPRVVSDDGWCQKAAY